MTVIVRVWKPVFTHFWNSDTGKTLCGIDAERWDEGGWHDEQDAAFNPCSCQNCNRVATKIAHEAKS